MSVRTIRGVACGFAFLVACSTSPQEPRPAQPSSAPSVADGSVAHRDPRLGVPSFAWLSRRDLPVFADVREAATAVLPRAARAFEVRGAALESFVAQAIDEIDATARGPIVVRYRQRVAGIDVFRGGISIAMTRAFEPIAASGLLAPTLDGSDKPFVLDASSAVVRAIAAVTGQASSSSLSSVAALHGYERFSAPVLARPARAKRVLFPRRASDAVVLEPAYYVEIALAGGPAWSLVVSAADGHVMFENDLTRHDAYGYQVFADPQSFVPMDGPQGNGLAPHPTGIPDGKKLTYVPSQLVTLANVPFSKNDPWLPAGATTTKGNNVHAYADITTPDGFTVATDVAPALTAASVFGSVYDTAASPNATVGAVQASATQLFYVTNFLHDWFYDSGFDEVSGNHQSDGLGRGGKNADALLAETQDSSGRNNANAQVPADGDSPIIQMFIFSGPSSASLLVTSPAGIAGSKTVGIASGFGKDVFDLTGDVVLAQDGDGADGADACEPLTNDVAGKIVLAHRTTCAFAQKAQNAQAAGAIGCIVANVATSTQPTRAPFMGGTASGITIPVLSVNSSDGQDLESAIGAGGATVTMKRSGGLDLDGTLDTSIVVHEWGHVLSGRLVSDGAGLRTNQAGGLGEGWGDFTALLVMARADDPGNFGGAYGNGSYATSGSGDDIYYGTRRLPYSVDFAKNALTLKHIQNGVALPLGVSTSFGQDGSSNSEVHNTGEVWATMLWECYVALLRDSARLPFAEAQSRMKRYLVASLKLTPPDPTLLEARDALLAAALAADPADFKLFWEAFARRGAGAGAIGPSKTSGGNLGVVESFFAGNDIQIVSAKLTDDVITCDHDGLLDEGEVGTVELSLRNSGSGTLTETVAQITSKTPGVTLDGAAEVKLPPLKPLEATTLKLRAAVRGPKPTEAIALDVALTDPSFAPGRMIAVTVPTFFHVDEAPDASATDNVETKETAWKVSGAESEATEKWSRIKDGSTYWSIANASLASDNYLTSPSFTIEGTAFKLSFKHRWSFRFSTRRMVDTDGGVVEVSVDNGKTWKDASEYGTVDYNSTLDTMGRGDNVLKGKKAYGNKSAGYPDQWVTSELDLELGEHPEAVRVRFRAGTGSGRSTADGWDIDDIALGGISSLPFNAFIPHADACDPEAPTASAGESRTVAPRTRVTLNGSATSPKSLPLTFLWTQVEGPIVKLENETTATPSFEAPPAATGTKIGFVLRAHDGALLSAASRTDTTVDNAAPEDGGCSCRTTGARTNGPSFLLAGGLALMLVRRLRRRTAA